MVIVDTTVWVDYLNGIPTPQTTWLDAELARQRLGLTDLILCEVLQGVRDDRQAAQTRHQLFGSKSSRPAVFSWRSPPLRTLVICALEGARCGRL